MTEKPHRSRTAWPGPTSAAGLEPGHDHELPSPLVQRAHLLTRAVVIFGVCLLLIGTSLVLIVLDRGKVRDEENARLQEQIRRSTCDLLDTFPEGVPALERSREKYGCGPGIPLALLTPEEQARVQSGRSTAPPAAPGPAPSMLEGASPNRQAPRRELPAPPRPELPPAAPTTSPAPEPPAVDPGSVTTPVCEALRICID